MGTRSAVFNLTLGVGSQLPLALDFGCWKFLEGMVLSNCS